ncbi:hypothetical protein ENSA7_46510 [Enhygromyxa salina]|uniref:Uncharacterized protein n=1 Tax=Enhygromyxa salina TaxID=215803 RepID=A0A2S9YJE7_9BACT|nr:hypothetical protein ENSA7_46510 [Enhygromyxa salina]
MTYEQSTFERNLIGRRQALCTLAGITTAVAGIALVGVGTARAAGLSVDGGEEQSAANTVTAQEAVQQIEYDAATARELAMVEALIPAGLDMGSWSIEKVQAPRLGAIAVVMRTPSGDAFQVDMLRRDASAAGLADTKHFSLFIANSGDGSTSTDEWQARGVKVLAHHISRTERSGAPLPELMTFSQRERQHPFGNYGVLG